MERQQNIKLFCLELQKTIFLIKLKMEEDKRKRERRFGVRKLLLQRRKKGFFHSLIPEMRLKDVESFVNFHRMDATAFDELLHILGPNLKNLPTKCKEEITAGERLAITLRYLASGDSMKSIGFYGFRIGASTTSNIIRETCALIWKKLQFVFPVPSEGMWKAFSDDFFLKWGFPNCLGAIDGKHVVIQAFPNHNSLTFNYKRSHSVVLMAVVDAHYKFIMVDIGALGHNSDGGVFKNSKFGNAILNDPQDLKIPEPKILPNTHEVAPYVFVADEAFLLRTNIMRPYPGRNLTNLPPAEITFNKCLSRARRLVECGFGILANRFRIYRKPIIASNETALNIIQATVCLHNWLRDRSDNSLISAEEVDLTTQLNENGSGLQPIMSSRSNHASQDAYAVREVFANYFSHQNYL